MPIRIAVNSASGAKGLAWPNSNRDTHNHFLSTHIMKLILRPVIFVLAAFLSVTEAQAAGNDPVPSPVRVSTVTFSQGTTLTNDDGSAMGVPHWIDERSDSNPNESPPFPDGNPDPDPAKSKPNNVKSYAHSYHCGEKPVVQAVFKWWENFIPPEGSPYSAEGKVVNTPNCQFSLPKKPLGGSTTYPATESLDQIVTINRIQAYVTGNRRVVRSDRATGCSDSCVPLTIEWTVYDRYNKVVGVSRSTHTIYVTWSKPSLALNKETLFSLSCVMANGMASYTETEKTAVADNIFSEFQDLEIRRMDDSVLTYYKEYNEVRSASGLLKYGDAQCGSFTELLCRALALGGVVSSPIKVTPIFIGVEPRILVKNWTFNQGTLPAPWTHRFKPDDMEESEVTDLPEGVKGQGKINPIAKRFRLHYVVHQSGRIFDPSYGKLASPATGSGVQSTWESDSLDGYDVTGTYPVNDNPLTFDDDINVARPEELVDLGTIFTVDQL